VRGPKSLGADLHFSGPGASGAAERTGGAEVHPRAPRLLAVVRTGGGRELGEPLAPPAEVRLARPSIPPPPTRPLPLRPLRDQASATILATYKRYGFRRVETPALENLKLLLGSGGGENEKLIYKVLKRGAKLDAATMQGEEDLADLGLRFDLTVPLARYYAHN